MEGGYRVWVNFQFYFGSSLKSSRNLYTRYCFLSSQKLRRECKCIRL